MAKHSDAAQDAIDLVDAAAENLRTVLHTLPAAPQINPGEAYRLIAEVYVLVSRTMELVNRTASAVVWMTELPLYDDRHTVDDDPADAVAVAHGRLRVAVDGLSDTYRGLTDAQNAIAHLGVQA